MGSDVFTVICKRCKNLLLILFFCVVATCSAQRFNTPYYGVTSDPMVLEHILEFKNDSIVEFSSVHRHMQPRHSWSLSYSVNDGVISIDIASSLGNDFIEFMKQIEVPSNYNSIKLVVDENVLLNHANKTVYLEHSEYQKMDYTTFVLDDDYIIKDNTNNKYYHLENGVLKTDKKRGRIFKRKMSNLTEDKFDIKILLGYDAYLKYGFHQICGVVEFYKR